MRFRHFDDDLVRSARQQDFLRQMKQQVTYTDLISKRDRLMRIFGRNTATDSRPARAARRSCACSSSRCSRRASRSRRSTSRAQIGPSYVEATDAQVKKLVQRFLDVEGVARPARPRPRRAPRAEAATQAAPLGRVAQPLRRHRPRRGSGPPGRPGRRRRLAPGLLPDAAPQLVAVRAAAARLQAPGTDGKRYGAYRMVIQRTNANGEYYGLQGTTWRNPPILDDPSETRTIGGREYELLLRRRSPAAGRLADAQGRVLDLEHAAPDAHQAADDGHRALGQALLLSG